MQRYGAPILTGILLALSFPSLHWYPLTWIALVPLFVSVLRDLPEDGNEARRDTRTAALFHACRSSVFTRFLLAGFVFHLLLFLWLLSNVYWAGAWAVFGYLGVCLILSLYWGVLGALWSRLRARIAWLPAAVMVGVLWLAMESLQNVLLSGFGWGALGYAQGKNEPLRQLASLGGVSLLSAIMVVFNMWVAQAIAERRRRLVHGLCAVLLLLAGHGAGTVMVDEPDYESEPLTVGLVQTNFAQGTKWDIEYSADMVQKTAHRSLLLVRETPVDLLVWPEGTIMEPIDSEPIRGSLAAMMRDVQTPLFTGAVRYNAEAGGWANSSYLIGANGLVLGYYDKIHLAPFGEYAPFEEHLPFIARHIPVIGATAAGEAPKTFGIGSRRFGPLICFEVLFPWMAEHLRSDGADFLIVITNLGWFGRSNAIVQEHEIGRLRAIETRLPVVHCANTGFSGVFDPWGRFTEVGPVHERLTGATRVAAPASHPLPWGPRMCRVLSVAVAGVLLAIAVAAGLVKARRTNAA